MSVPRSDRMTFVCDRVTDIVNSSLFVHVCPPHLYVVGQSWIQANLGSA